MELTASHTRQVIALPVIPPAVTHWMLHQGRCLSCGTLCQAGLPGDQVSGYGPGLTGFSGERAGIGGASRSAVHDCSASVFGIPLSAGAMQKRVDRVAEAIVPREDTIGQGAHTAPVTSMDETSWLIHGDRHGLGVMANAEVAYGHIHPTRAKAACVQLMADGRGILVSDGYRVYPYCQGLWQSRLGQATISFS